MKTMVLKENLKDGLGVVERVATRSLSLPILGNVLISAKKNSLILSATDLEIGITYEVLATTKEEGQAVASPKILSPFVALLGEERVALEQQGDALAVVSGEQRAAVKTLNADDFPVIPSLRGDEELQEVETQILCRSVSQVVGMTGQSQARPEISGVFFLFEKDALKVVGTDSFRLAEKTLTLQKTGAAEHGFILPAKTARELIAVLGERPGKTKMYTSPTQVVFDYVAEEHPAQPHIQIVSRLVEGEYPHYQDIIPSQYKTKATLSRNEFANRLKAASIFSGKSNEVRFGFAPKEKEVRISSQSADAGENASVLKGQVEGEALDIAFNWRFVAEGLAQMRSEQIEIRVSSEEGPTLIKPVGEERYLYVVMPVKA